MRTIIHSLLKRIGRYEIIAFVTGFILMAYELAASRILAPTIGTSIYVWTSVIGVMIAALAIGYAAGGWVADRRGKRQDVAWLLLASAVSVVFTCICYQGVLETISLAAADPRLQGVLASIILFAPASFVLGMISPYLAKLRINSLRTTGRSVAMLSALNSVGGISGTFSAGFIFFNYMGSRETLILLAGLLLACSWAAMGRKYTNQLAAAAIAIGAVAALQFVAPAQASVTANIDTPTSHYRIADLQSDWRTLRVLITGPGGYQSGVYTTGDKDLAFGYTRQLANIVAAAPEKKRILILGGGAFTLPEYLGREYPDAAIDVVEIDPELPEIARQYFRYMPTDNITTIARDARAYLESTDKHYDIIIVDVYNDASVPFSIATREYTAALKRVATDTGVIAVNIIAGTNDGCIPLLSSLHRSYGSSFNNSRFYPIDDPSMAAKQNIIGVYGNASLTWTDPLPGRAAVTIPLGQSLTDNYAPTERLIRQCL